MKIYSLDECIGNTPLVRLQKLYSGPNLVLVKLEGDNPGGSVKDRAVKSMIEEAERSGRIRPGDTLIEATSGNTGIAYAMLAAAKGYKMIILMPEHMSIERRMVMQSYNAEIMLTASEGNMELAIDTARSLEKEGKGVILDQFSNPANPLAHYRATGEEIWKDTDGKVTHFVASTGTTGTLMGISRLLKERNSHITIVAVRPEENSEIAGIRDWPEAYLPKIYDKNRVDVFHKVTADEAFSVTRDLAAKEGIFCGASSGGNVAVAIRVAKELSQKGCENAVIVTLACDRGDRYLSSGIFNSA